MQHLLSRKYCTTCIKAADWLSFDSTLCNYAYKFGCMTPLSDIVSVGYVILRRFGYNQDGMIKDKQFKRNDVNA